MLESIVNCTRVHHQEYTCVDTDSCVSKRAPVLKSLETAGLVSFPLLGIRPCLVCYMSLGISHSPVYSHDPAGEAERSLVYFTNSRTLTLMMAIIAKLRNAKGDHHYDCFKKI